MGSRVSGTETGTVDWDAAIANSSFTCCTIMPTLQYLISFIDLELQETILGIIGWPSVPHLGFQGLLVHCSSEAAWSDPQT